MSYDSSLIVRENLQGIWSCHSKQVNRTAKHSIKAVRSVTLTKQSDWSKLCTYVTLNRVDISLR